MEKYAQSFDVCIICALPEEARAFLEVARPYCKSPLEERISPSYHYSYRFATLQNIKDETLGPAHLVAATLWAARDDAAFLTRFGGVSATYRHHDRYLCR